MTQLITLIQKQWLTLSLTLATGIALASLWPAESLPAVPGSDKTHHFIAYALLILPVALTRPQYQLTSGLVCLLFSGVIELIQPQVNRYGEWLDLLANAGGIACGIILAFLIRRLYSTLSSANKQC